MANGNPVPKADEDLDLSRQHSESDQVALFSARRAYVDRCMAALRDCTKSATTVGARKASRAIAALQELISSADEEMEEALSTVTTASAERAGLRADLRKLLGTKPTPAEVSAEYLEDEIANPDDGLVPHSTSTAGELVGIAVNNNVPDGKLPIGKRNHLRKWTVKMRSTLPVQELRKRIARSMGLVSSEVNLRIKNKIHKSPLDCKKTLQQVGISKAAKDCVVFVIHNDVGVDATEATSPMLVDPGAATWRDTQLTHAAEKMVSEVFARYCNEKGTLDHKGVISFFRAVDVTDPKSVAPARIQGVFKEFDTTNSGEITYKGFNQFYTEACKSRINLVQADILKLGYNLYTLQRDRPWPEDRKKADAERKAKSDEEAAAAAALKAVAAQE